MMSQSLDGTIVARESGKVWTPRGRLSHSDSFSMSEPTARQSQLNELSATCESSQPRTRGIPVQVVVRFRPRVLEEDHTAFCILPNGKSVESVDGTYCFDFSRAFAEAASQEQVFEHVGKPVVVDVLNGYNGTVLAYGQTSSGKTYSMYGESATENVLELHGIVPRAAQQVFHHIESSVEDTEFTLRCSFMEVYREKMKDLLRPNFEALRVKEVPQRGLFVDGLSREYVTCAADVMAVIRAGLRTRVVGKTRCNLYSSRSHVIFVLHVEQSSPQGDEKLGKLTLVDLAGSEKVSKSDCAGETFEEAKKINWSLSALGKVIDALAEQRPHVPYRDSQLTRVLQEALGGNCRTTLLVAASGCAQHADETLSSLRFATRAKSVRNVAKVNYTYSPEQLLLLVAKLQKQLVGAHEHIVELSQVPRLLQESPRHDMPERTRASSSRLSRRSASSKFDAVSEEASASSSTRPAADFSESTEAPMEDEDDDMEGVGLLWYDDAFKPFATAAQDAISSFEATLLAQEKSLAEVRLLRASREDGVDRTNECSGSEEHDLMSERFRVLQSGASARSYQWRWHLERYKCESLIMELKMRTKFSQDLETALAEAKSKIAELQEQRQGDSPKKASFHSSSNKAVLLAEASCRSLPKSTGSLGASTRDKPRIARPVPRKKNTTPLSKPASNSGVFKEGTSILTPRQLLKTLSPGKSRPVEDTPPAAGTGDTGGEVSGHPSERCSGSDSMDPREKNEGTLDTSVRLHMEGLQQSYDALQLEFQQQQELLERRNRKLQEVRNQIHAKDLQLSALRHEIRIKDALLSCLQDEERQHFEIEDFELQTLLEKALSPLTAILTRQMGTAGRGDQVVVQHGTPNLSAR